MKKDEKITMLREYELSDYWAAAFLMTQGFEVVRIYNKPRDPRRQVFVLRGPGGGPSLLSDYYNDRVKPAPQPRQFKIRLQDLKNMMYDRMREIKRGDEDVKERQREHSGSRAGSAARD